MDEPSSARFKKMDAEADTVGEEEYRREDRIADWMGGEVLSDGGVEEGEGSRGSEAAGEAETEREEGVR